MKQISLFVLCLFTGCNPAEISLLETVTEEAVIIEHDIFESQEKIVVPTDKGSECRCENAV
jgi:hypothetical protein